MFEKHAIEASGVTDRRMAPPKQDRKSLVLHRQAGAGASHPPDHQTFILVSFFQLGSLSRLMGGFQVSVPLGQEGWLAPAQDALGSTLAKPSKQSKASVHRRRSNTKQAPK